MDDLTSIVVAARGGDIDAFATLVHRYQDLAFGAAFARLSDSQLAQDVAQEAFLQAYRDLPMLRVAGQVQSLLRQVRGDGADGASIANGATRVRRLRQFQSQPFFVAEPWTARPGEAVALCDTLSGYSTIASGAADDLSETDLLYVGRLRIKPPDTGA